MMQNSDAHLSPFKIWRLRFFGRNKEVIVKRQIEELLKLEVVLRSEELIKRQTKKIEELEKAYQNSRTSKCRKLENAFD
jgi:hypothetical protein